MPRSSQATSKRPPEAVRVDGICVSYGDHAVLDDISFSVKRGNIAALIGPNGSGKSTLVRAILGLTPTDTGRVHLFGKPLQAVRQDIGYVPQHFDFDRRFPITVKEFLGLSLRRDCPTCQAHDVIDEVGLERRAVHEQLGTLSGGQLQRVLIAQAILNNPKLLFLDEPSTGIDIIGEQAFLDIIRHLNEDHGTTILLVSHDLSMVSNIVDQVICVNKKLMCSGPPKKALSKKTIQALYGPHAAGYAHQHHHTHAKR